MRGDPIRKCNLSTPCPSGDNNWVKAKRRSSAFPVMGGETRWRPQPPAAYFFPFRIVDVPIDADWVTVKIYGEGTAPLTMSIDP